MTARDLILNTVLTALHPLTAKEVASRAGANLNTTRPILVSLCKDELIARDSGPYEGNWAYYYFARGELELVERENGSHLVGDKDVDTAIARSKWDGKELFTREQVREYREKYGRLKSHGVIWR